MPKRKAARPSATSSKTKKPAQSPPPSAPAPAPTADVAEVAKQLDAVRAALEGGMAPVAVDAAWLCVWNTEDLHAKGAVRVLVHTGKPPVKTMNEYDLLAELLCDDDPELCFGMDPAWLQLQARFRTVGDAIPAIIAAKKNNKKLKKKSDEELTRLEKLWTAWMAGVGWRNCEMHNRNRPSLASWDGWPWDWNNVLPRAITPPKAKNIEVYRHGAPESLVPDYMDAAMLPMFKKLYDRTDPSAVVDSIPDALKHSLDVARSLAK